MGRSPDRPIFVLKNWKSYKLIKTANSDILYIKPCCDISEKGSV